MHETVESSVSHKNRKKMTCLEHFWKMRPAKCAQDCSESSISHKSRKPMRTFGAFFFGMVEFARQNVQETVGRARFHIKSLKAEGFRALLEDEVGKFH